MGDWTGLRGKIVLKQPFLKVFKEWEYLKELSFSENLGVSTFADSIRESYDHSLWCFAEGHPVIRRGLGYEMYMPILKWSNFQRCRFIPYGMVCYMPDEWGKSRQELIGNTLNFACSLKNYGDEIGFFIENVLPVIGESWHLEKLYEEDSESTFYVKEGEV